MAEEFSVFFEPFSSVGRLQFIFFETSDVVFQIGLIGLFPIDIQGIIIVLDGISRKTDDPFDDVLGFAVVVFFTGNDNVETINREVVDHKEVLAISQGWIHWMAIHLDRSPKEDARGDDETNDDAEEAPFFKESHHWWARWLFWTSFWHNLSF